VHKSKEKLLSEEILQHKNQKGVIQIALQKEMVWQMI